MNDFIETQTYKDGKSTVFKTAKRDKGFAEEMSQFVKSVAGGLAPVIPFEQIDAVTRTCLLAARSLISGVVYPL